MTKADELVRDMTASDAPDGLSEEAAEAWAGGYNAASQAAADELDQMAKALRAFVKYDDCDPENGVEMMALYDQAITSARAALRAAGYEVDHG